MQEELKLPQTYAEINRQAQRMFKAADIVNESRARVTQYKTGVKGENGNGGKIRSYGVKLNIPEIPIEDQARMIAEELNRVLSKLSADIAGLAADISQEQFRNKISEKRTEGLEK